METTTTRTGLSIDFLQTIGTSAFKAGLSLDDVVATVEGQPNSDYEDQAIAARAFFSAKQQAA